MRELFLPLPPLNALLFTFHPVSSSPSCSAWQNLLKSTLRPLSVYSPSTLHVLSISTQSSALLTPLDVFGAQHDLTKLSGLTQVKTPRHVLCVYPSSSSFALGVSTLFTPFLNLPGVDGEKKERLSSLVPGVEHHAVTGETCNSSYTLFVFFRFTLR